MSSASLDRRQWMRPPKPPVAVSISPPHAIENPARRHDIDLFFGVLRGYTEQTPGRAKVSALTVF
ncbi:hypothetical protein GCM10023156_48560 [Novipirellula rosea]|uniref:Uncharacterized protein n=1 Tax=Novipirellula rosea TaxID=1031540 RepID=A0ABP8NC98_9BACT